MYKKTFVSIYFSQTKLHFVQLELNKKQVHKFGSVDLPPGVIQNYKVVDANKLTETIKLAYKQYHFREKAVGLVVPEFSTYTRTLSLPRLDNKELDEAVRWKMRDYLPDSGVDMVMDWKILQSSSSMVEVLVVCIPQSVLLSYVIPVEAAGLYPLIVETPALSLARISGSQAVSQIVLYSNWGEAILLALQGQEILGSVVAGSTDQPTLLKLVSQMSKHYSENPPQKLVLGGLDINQSTLTTLQQTLKIPIEWFKLLVKGFTPPQVQEFLIPISLQLKDPTEPADETTINLLPQHWVKVFEDKQLKLRIWSLILTASTVLWCCLFIVLGVNLILDRQMVQATGAAKASEQISTEVLSEVNNANLMADNVVKILDSRKNPVDIINSIAQAKVNGIILNKFEINLENGKTTVEGVAADRKSLVDFKNALDENSDFGSIVIPLGSLQQESNIVFHFEFDYLPSAKPKTGGQVKLQL